MLTRHALMRAELMKSVASSSLRPTKTVLNLDTLDHMGSMESSINRKFVVDDLHYRAQRHIPPIHGHGYSFGHSTGDRVIRSWARSHLRDTQFNPSNPRVFDNSRIILSKGIRHSVNGIMTHFKQTNNSSVFYVPNDVYPVYGQIAKKVGVPHNSYPTIFGSGILKYLEFIRDSKSNLDKKKSDSTDLSDHLTDHPSEIAVIADPMPLSRSTLTKKDRDLILRWLDEAKNRFVIIDSVYSTSFNQIIEPLLATNRVFYLNSLSKSHCSPNMLGINIIPSNFEEVLRESLEKELTDETLQTADVMLGLYTQRDAMKFQSHLFSRAWKSVDQQLIDRGFMPTVPDFGDSPYLKMYQIPYDTLLKSNVISIPMDVYERPDMYNTGSIVSCLDQAKQILETSPPVPKTMYHVTLLSNFFKAYDKYTNRYSKAKLPESTFPDKFHLLLAQDIGLGVEKASKLLKKLDIKDDKLILIETKISNETELFRTEVTGKGYFIKSPDITVSDLHILNDPEAYELFGSKTRGSVETIMARSMGLSRDRFKPYHEIVPRSISILPVAKGCQAKCSFCFSHSSVSDDTTQKLLKPQLIDHILKISKQRGAERVVITGGGEPTLVPHHLLIQYIKLCKNYFDKIVLITNGYAYSNKKISEDQRLEYLQQIHEAGLNVLSVSRHGYDEETNTKIMNLETNSVNIAQTVARNPQVFKSLQLRWVCVLQKQGVNSIPTLERYLDFATETQASQICFKELYVSVSEESVYYDRSYNKFSRENQIPLSMVTQYLEAKNAKLLFSLPWGSPVYELIHRGKKIQIACYTEPSLFWERSQGICRSWNLMADGKIYASLEDLKSQIDL